MIKPEATSSSVLDDLLEPVADLLRKLLGPLADEAGLA